MSIVKAKNKKTGITYVYESESYWDKEKKQPRNKRKLIGKLDEQTGEIVPTRGHNRIGDPSAPNGTPQTEAKLRDQHHDYVAQLARQEELIRSQADELAKLKSEKTDLVKKLMELARAYGA